MDLTADVLPDLVVIRAFSRSSLEQEYVDQLRMLGSYAAVFEVNPLDSISPARKDLVILRKSVLGVLRRSLSKAGCRFLMQKGVIQHTLIMEISRSKNSGEIGRCLSSQVQARS